MRSSLNFLGRFNMGQAIGSLLLLGTFIAPRILYDFHLIHPKDHHHQDSCEVATQTECHLTVYHAEYAISCEHDIHLTEIEDECKWCDLTRLLTLDYQFPFREVGFLELPEKEYKTTNKGTLTSRNGVHRLKRGPPVA